MSRNLLSPACGGANSDYLPLRAEIVAHPLYPTLLRKHAGQVAFRGGNTDTDDVSVIATALREAQGEVIIDPRHVRRVPGELPPVNSGRQAPVLSQARLKCWKFLKYR